MKMKSIIMVLVAAAFLLSSASLSVAAGMGVNGTVTKIEGTKVTVQDDMGKETTIDVKDVKDTKVGDKVKIEDGDIKSPTDEPAAPEKPAKPGY